MVEEGEGAVNRRHHVPTRGGHLLASEIHTQAHEGHVPARGGWTTTRKRAAEREETQEHNGGAGLMAGLA